MGHQVQFHLLPDDASSFLAFAESTAPVMITARDSPTPEIEAIDEPHLAKSTLTLWNREVLPNLKRKKVLRDGAETYYRIDSALPVIEFCPCRSTIWNSSEALLQGRIYSSFDQPSDHLAAWYKSLERWLRKNLEKGPSPTIGGLIGQSALAWFNAGGVVLPMFNPPITSEWLEVMTSQHRVSLQ